jgi:phenylalanyl-tRNA synthetase beta chain
MAQDEEIQEENRIAGLAYGPAQPEHWDALPAASGPVDFFAVKGDVAALLSLAGCSSHDVDYVASEHPALRPGRTARVERGGTVLGWVGELHPRVARRAGLSPAPVVFELAAGPTLAGVLPRFRPVSRYPSVRRDLAVMVTEATEVGRLLDTVRAAAGETLRDVVVFDVYRGDKIEKGLKSIALGLILQETSRTLNESDIQRVIDAVVSDLSGQFNATIRE